MGSEYRARVERCRRFRWAAIVLFAATVVVALVAVWTESPNWWGTTGILAVAALVCMFAAIPS